MTDDLADGEKERRELLQAAADARRVGKPLIATGRQPSSKGVTKKMSRSKLKLFAVSSLSMSVLGCATLPELESTLNASKPCCSTYAQMPIQQLPADKAVDFRLTAESPVFEFEVGKSYFI